MNKDGSSLDDSIKKSKKNSNIPDGGWGWVVLAAAFFMRVIMVGIYVSFALYTKDFIIEFQTTPGVMGWMISIYSSVSLLIAPVASYLALKFGFRTVSIIGLLISGITYPATYFYPTLWFTFLTASIIVPIAQGLANICANVILTVYFDKKLSIAMGVFSTGSGVASFLITPIMTIVIDKFGWRLSKVLYSTLYILAALCALTFKPIKPDKIPKEKDEEEQKQIIETEKVDNFIFGSKDSNIFHFISMANLSSNLPIQEDSKRHYTSLQNMGYNYKQMDKTEVNVVNIPLTTLVGLSVASNLQLKAATESVCEKNLDIIVIKNEESNSNVKSKSVGYIGLLTQPVFLIFLLSNLMTNLGYDTPYLYAKVKALEMGASESQATFLLTCLGIGNIIGRLGFGILGAKKQINMFWLYTSCPIAAGLFVIMSRIAFSYPLMIVYSVGFGTFIGGYVTLSQVLLTQLLDITDFSNGLSLMFVVQAIGFLAGAPISGMIFDTTKSFNWPFIYCGLIILISGLILLACYCSKSFRQKQKN